MYFDPKKSFDTPQSIGLHSVGIGKDKVVLGKYTPITDCVAFAYKTKKINIESIVKDIYKTKNPLLRGAVYHELIGHVNLTKSSSYWPFLVLNNFSISHGFLRMAINVDNINQGNVIENMRKQIVETIRYNTVLNLFHDDWIPLQETISNTSLYSELMQENDISEKEVFSLLIEENKKSKLVYYLSNTCEEILNILGYETGFNFLLTMAKAASSPKLFDPIPTPSNEEEYKTWKRMQVQLFSIKNLIKPVIYNPTKRFIKMINYVAENLEKINKKIKKNVSPGEIAIRIAQECNCEIQLIDDFISDSINWLKILSSDKKALRSEIQRNFYRDTIRFMKYFQKMRKDDFPTYTFANDLKSNKILYAPLKTIRDCDELDIYLFSNVLLYQYLRSLEDSKDYIKCFDHKLTMCKPNCKGCEMDIIFKFTKKLLRISENFKYTDLKREAMDPNKVKDSLCQ